MKFHLICFSINQLLRDEKTKTLSCRDKKLRTLVELRKTAKAIEVNPNETIVNLSGWTLSLDEIEVLQLGLRHGLATRPNQFEIMVIADVVWDQLSLLEKFKVSNHT